MVNLLLPKLDWGSETEAIQQGLSTLVTLTLCFAAVAIPAAAYVSFFRNSLSAALYLLLAVAFTLLTLLLVHHLSGDKSQKAFENLR